MKKPRLRQTLSAILLASVAVWAAVTMGPRSEASAATVSAAYDLTFQVNAPTTVPDGATITCKTQLVPRLTGLERMVASPVPVQSVEGTGTVSGASATCSVRVPFAFSVDQMRDGAALSYEIDAFTAAGPVFVRTQQGIAVALPPTGSIQNLRFNVNL